MTAQVLALEVEIHEALEFGCLHLHTVARGAAGADIVDQNVDSPKRLDSLSHHFRDLIVPSDIRPSRQYPGSGSLEIRRSLLQPFRNDVINHDRRPLAGQGPCGCLSDTLAGTRNQSDLPLQSHIRFRIVSAPRCSASFEQNLGCLCEPEQ